MWRDGHQPRLIASITAEASLCPVPERVSAPRQLARSLLYLNRELGSIPLAERLAIDATNTMSEKQRRSQWH
jgi:hypothetical protein